MIQNSPSYIKLSNEWNSSMWEKTKVDTAPTNTKRPNVMSFKNENYYTDSNLQKLTWTYSAFNVRLLPVQTNNSTQIRFQYGDSYDTYDSLSPQLIPTAATAKYVLKFILNLWSWIDYRRGNGNRKSEIGCGIVKPRLSAVDVAVMQLWR